MFQKSLNSKIRGRNTLLVTATFLLFFLGATSAIITTDFSVLEQNVTVNQAVIIDDQTGVADLEPENFPDGNLIGTGNNSWTWDMDINIDESFTTDIKLTGDDSEHLQDHFTSEPDNEHGFSLIIDSEVLVSESDETLDLSNGEASVTFEGETNGAVNDAIELRSWFPINYNVTGSSTGDMNLEISMDAEEASIE